MSKSVEEKLNDFVAALLRDSRFGKIRWQYDRGRMRTVVPISSRKNPDNRRYVFMQWHMKDCITVSISEPMQRDTFWSHVVCSSDVMCLYQEAMNQQEEVNRILDEIISDLEPKKEKYESPHWILNGVGGFVKRIFRKEGSHA